MYLLRLFLNEFSCNTKFLQKKTCIFLLTNKYTGVVNDLEKYPEFLKWCKSSFINEKNSQSYVAGMVISISGIQIEFSTQNTITYEGETIVMDMALMSGPFKKMSGQWRFKQFAELGSKVELQLTYEVKSKLLGRMFTKGFDQIASQLVNDFVKRAQEIYVKN